MTPGGPDYVRVLHGNPGNEDLAVLTVVLRAATRHLAAVPDRPSALRADWGDAQHSRCWSAGSWRAASRGWERGNRRA
ncbi:acyl-CoA carboxylase subunit epsilon [Streptomyces sp. NBC_01615]|uniref:acyl-CoA carboxylase subunit epsilon n=1 Tax=Streptomyces sp. NBC_01615 TaxID=2975898 RepID=UPI0038658744